MGGNGLDSASQAVLGQSIFVYIDFMFVFVSFQNIIKLKPYGGCKDVDLVRASRGSCIHLPMPLQGTIDHTLSTLPSTEGLKILVESTTKSLNVHRTVVDVQKVAINYYDIFHLNITINYRSSLHWSG